MRRLHPVSTLLAPTLVVMAAGLPARAEAPPVVDFSTAPTAFNPDNPDTPYVVTINDEGGAGTLYSVSTNPDPGGSLYVYEELPHTGQATLTKFNEGLNVHITVKRCTPPEAPATTPTDCTTVATSPDTAIFRAIRNLGIFEVPNTQVGLERVQVDVAPRVPGTELTVDWTMLDSNDAPVPGGTGQSVVTTDQYGNLTLDIAPPAGIPDGVYGLKLEVSGTFAGFGPLTGSNYPVQPGSISGRRFGVDVTKPVISRFSMGSSTFFPVKDGYQDATRLAWTTQDSNLVSEDISIRNAAGTEVYAYTSNAHPAGAEAWTWDGTTYLGGAVAPAGTYTAHLTVTDTHFNTSTTTATVVVSGKRLVTKTFRRSVSAQGSTVDQLAGACSRLRRPALRGWSGSIGYYSNTRCQRSFDASLALTVNRVAVPRAFQNRYGAMVVKPWGGAASARPRSRALLQYVRPDGTADSAAWLGSAVGWHSGATVSARGRVHGTGSSQPFVLWSAATADGARYEIRNFQVVLNYVVLE